MKKILFIAVLVLAFAFTPRSNYSANTGGVVVTNIIFTMHPDTAPNKVESIGLRNTSDKEMQVTIKKADYKIAQDGAFQIKEVGSTPESIAKFINVEESTFTMAPKSTKNVDVSLSNNKNYILPEYWGTVLVESAESTPQTANKNNSKFTINVNSQVAVIVRLQPGSLLNTKIDTSKSPLQIIKIGIPKFLSSGGEKDVSLTLKNNGLLTLQPTITTKLVGKFTNDKPPLNFNSRFIQPSNEHAYKSTLKPSVWGDMYTASFNMKYTYAGKQFNDTVNYTFFVINYILLIGILLILAGIVFQVLVLRRKNKMIKKLLVQQKEEPSDVN